MRISFDVHDTLVCDPSTPTEPPPSWPYRWFYPEPLRRGTPALLHSLLRDRHELWIYTTSHRGERYLKGWFRTFGVRLGGVVNQARHEATVGRRGPSKYPPAFGVDLHVDDSEGVREEGLQHRFAVVVVSPGDLDWAAKVREAVERRSHRPKRDV